jgi:LacI family transcriptional regulator
MNRLFQVRLLIETSREYGRALLRGIYRYNSVDSRWLIEQQTPWHAGSNRTDEASPGQLAGHVDGVIMRDRKGSLELLKKGIPVIFAGYLHEDVRDTHRIVTDDLAIARRAATHLLERGFGHFAFVGHDHLPWSRRRREAFVEAVRQAGYECAPFAQARRRALREWPQEQKSLAEWLCALPKPVGLLACNDDRARQVIDICLATGLSVPDEIALVGVDNDEFVCNLSNPPISSVALAVEDAGYEAAQRLHQLMTGGRPKPQDIVPATLGVAARRSSEVTVVQDVLVARAVQFIRDNCCKPIQVPDVLREVALSRRVLYRRFQRALGCGVSEYIRKVRAAQIERMLLDTDCSIAEIAEALGFPSAGHIASYFRSVRGTNPLTFRTARRTKA